jgi:hypothetical protein
LTTSSSQLNDQKKPLQEIYAALGHAIRLDIVQYLGAFHRPVQYSELVEWLQIKPGSFYFHIKKLKDLVEQDSEKRFLLTPLGKLALEVIESDRIIHTGQQPVANEANKEPVLPSRFSIMLFGEYVRRLTFNRRNNFLIGLLVACQIILLNYAQLGMIPFFLDGGLYYGLVGCILEVLFSMVIIWVLLELIMRYYSPIKGYSWELLGGIPLTLIPLFLYPLLVVISEYGFNLPLLAGLLANAQVTLVMLFFLQVISAIFLVQLLQVIKRVNFERALVPVFIVLYGFSILSFLISGII